MSGGGTPTVSIGLPVYNGINYMEEALESLLTQTFDDLEVVIADNASTDATEEIARRFVSMDDRIRYFRHETNLGAAPNYNFTLEKARGEYFMWAAHDDLRAPEFVERALLEIRRTPDAASVFSKAVRIDEAGERVRALTLPAELNASDPITRFRAAVTCTYPGVVVFGLMRRSLLDETGRHGNYPGADRVLAAELALRGPLIEIPEPLFFSRDHPNRYVKIKLRQGRKGQSLWWDADRAGAIDVPAWKRLNAYVRAPRAAGMRLPERVRCHGALARAVLDNRGGIARELLGDTLRAGARQVQRLSRSTGS